MSTPIFDPDDEKIVAGALRPKDAATLVLVQRESEPRVLMGRRHQGMAFMAGKYVFPGGRVDPGDQRVMVGSELRPDVLAKLTGDTTPSRARGLALAAIRETFEETGIIARRTFEKIPRTRNGAWKRFFAHGLDAAARPARVHRPRHHAAQPHTPFRCALLHGGCGPYRAMRWMLRKVTNCWSPAG